MEQNSFINSIVDRQAEKHIYWTFDYVLKWVLIISVLLFSTGIGALLFGSAIVYADETPTTTPCFEVTRLSGASANDIKASGVAVGTNTVSSNVYSVYVGIYPNTWTGTTNLAALYTSGGRVYAVLWSPEVSGGVSSTGVLRSAYNNNTGTPNYGSIAVRDTSVTPEVTVDGYFAEVNMCASTNFSTTYTIFNSRTDAVQAIYDYDPAPAVTKYQSSYLLQAGHAVYIPIQDGYSFTLVGAFNEWSSLTGTPWPNDNRTYGIVNELPSTVTLPSGLTPITWSKNAGGDRTIVQKITGQTKQGVDGIRDVHYTGPGYMCIVNPAYYDNDKYNGNILITGEFYGEVYDYEILAELDPVAGILTSFNNVTNPYTATVDADGRIITHNSDGEVPSNGGPNYIPSAEDLRQDNENVIQQLLHSIQDLLSAPIAAIQTLISSATGFFAVIAGLWTWLPSDISQLITGALTICVTLAVIKIFWK